MEHIYIKESPKETFTWIPFYKELAESLLQFRHNRAPLVAWIYSELSKVKRSDGQSLTKYLHKEDGSPIDDIDPFSVMAIFNRGSMTFDNRKKMLELFKQWLSLQSEVPSDFDGIPVVDPRRAFFFSWYSDNAERIDVIWKMFEKALSNADISEEYDYLHKIKGLKNNLTMVLFWIRPYDYLALDSRNRKYLNSIGISVAENSDYATYKEILAKVNDYISNGKIPYNSFPELSLGVWQGGYKEERNIWLAGYTFGSNNSQYGRFIKNSIWEAWFNDDSKSDQKLLQLTKSIKEGDVIVLKSTSTKGKNHDQPFLRVKAVGVVCGDIDQKKTDKATLYKCSVKYISTFEIDFDGSVYGSFRKTIHRVETKAKSLIDYVNMLIKGNMANSKYSEYINLLKSNHNLVLTGAPGTGKTFMAHAIAKEMEAETKFVQFHPSYDYTDFVEGLRPVDNGGGQIGFERKDGVFKSFCSEAIKNLRDSAKSAEELSSELSWEDKLQQFVDDAIENATEYKLSKGNVFTIVDMDGHRILASNESDKANKVMINVDIILDLLNNDVRLDNVKDVRRYFDRKFNTQADSYVFSLVSLIREMKPTELEHGLIADAHISKVKRKPFVFIIDEINRGDMSKIFGELFYAIDPGYRVKADDIVANNIGERVLTQYQNLVPESDVFAKGFYVPDNMYILATMNDIDRSVESMDFAMRRRFSWTEVTPKDTENMLDDCLDADMAAVAKAAMNSLNEKIAGEEGLGAEYAVGPAYFLKLKDNGGDMRKLWEMNILPLLKEYTRGLPNSKGIMQKFETAYNGAFATTNV